MFTNLLQAIQAAIASLLAQLTGTTTGTPPSSGGSPTPILPTLGGGGNLFTGVTGSPFDTGNGTPSNPAIPEPNPLPTIKPTLPAVTPNPLPFPRPAAPPPIVPNPLPFGR